MILSAQQTFSDNQAITTTARSTNVIDLGVPGTPHGGAAALEQDVGKGTPIPILVQVTEDFDNLTSLDVAIEVGAADTLGTVVATQNILLADLVAGKTINLQCLPNGVDQRYLGLRFTVNGTDPTQGQIHAGISMGNQTNF
ncbi:MAG: Bbp16 family capsid cement protein [Candidatus Thiodiazotropha lotti]